MGFLSKRTREPAFWEWFAKHEGQLFDFESNKEATFDALSGAMKGVHPDLTFEFGPVSSEGKREFIISAGGIISAFPAVEALADAAPSLARWTVLKYRQRKESIFDLKFGPHSVKAKDVHYVLVKDDQPGKIGILLFLDGYSDDEPGHVWQEIGYLFLDQSLGEYDVETHLGMIMFANRQSKHFKHAKPITELAADFDSKIKRD